MINSVLINDRDRSCASSERSLRSDVLYTSMCPTIIPISWFERAVQLRSA